MHEIATQLRIYGITFAIDDFGEGFSSFARLRDVPFVELKLDRSFVRDSGSDPTNAGICQTIIDLAHNFGALAVAEGLENAADLQAVQRMGCDIGQGFFLARPMPKASFIALLERRALQNRHPKPAGMRPCIDINGVGEALDAACVEGNPERHRGDRGVYRCAESERPMNDQRAERSADGGPFVQSRDEPLAAPATSDAVLASISDGIIALDNDVAARLCQSGRVSAYRGARRRALIGKPIEEVLDIDPDNPFRADVYGVEAEQRAGRVHRLLRGVRRLGKRARVSASGRLHDPVPQRERRRRRRDPAAASASAKRSVRSISASSTPRSISSWWWTGAATSCASARARAPFSATRRRR